MENNNQGQNVVQQPETGKDELSQQQQEKISGGWGDIKGGSTDDKHKDWSEVSGYSHGIS
jgi:hypothetical protein